MAKKWKYLSVTKILADLGTGERSNQIHKKTGTAKLLDELNETITTKIKEHGKK